jgi:hypothetical protein
VLSAIHQGFEVFVIGDVSAEAHSRAIERIEQASGQRSAVSR